jgi:lipopolysaccharide export system permease protein
VQLAKTHVDAVIKERTFIDRFDGLMLYVNQVDIQNRSMKDVFIEDQRNPKVNNVIVAPSGHIASDPEKQVIRLKLFNGAINQVDLAQQSAHVISFKTYEMKLDLKEMMSNEVVRKPIEEMTLIELNEYIQSLEAQGKTHNKAVMKFHEKFTLPFACFALGLVAVPLGIRSKRNNRSMGTVMGIFLFLTYYILLSVGWSLGDSGALPPVIGMWAPNVILCAIGIYLYIRMLDDQPSRFRRWLEQITQRAKNKKP